MTWKLVDYLKDYCANCTLAGFAYIANCNLHITERIFWLICVLLSAAGSYHLITEYEHNFQKKAVSIVYESLPPHSKIKFPTISVCDIVYKYNMGPDVEAYIESLGKGIEEEYNYDVETHVSFIMFPYLYHEGTIKSHCQPYEDCAECAKCPKDNYRALLTRFGANCSDMFESCSLAGRDFDCCQYFLPLITPFGRCFMLNSLQNNKRKSKTWLHTSIDPALEVPEMKIVSKHPMQIGIMNAEDLPHAVVPSINVIIMEPGQHKIVQIYIEEMVNDADVRDTSPTYRQCRFANELLPNSAYKSYSFTSCLADCARENQLHACNCSAYTNNPYNMKLGPDCDLSGYYCLETHSMIKPDLKAMLRATDETKRCNCLSSCEEADLRLIYESMSQYNKSSKMRSVTLSMPNRPMFRYRRQTLRTRLDIIVTIGGILGLFLGASILSGIELVYYFTLRIFNSVWMAKQRRTLMPNSNVA